MAKLADKEKARKNRNYSMNIGIITTTIIAIGIIKDIFIGGDNILFDVLSGIFVFLFTLFALKTDLASKILNKKNMNDSIDLWAIFSIAAYILEKLILSWRPLNLIEKAILIIMIIISAGFLYWIFFKKKDRKYNVE